MRRPSSRKREHASTVIDRYRSQSRTGDDPVRQRTREGRQKLAEQLTEALENATRDETAFTVRTTRILDPEEHQVSVDYHDFCNEFSMKEKDWRVEIANMTRASKETREMLLAVQESIDWRERQVFREEMDLPYPPDSDCDTAPRSGNAKK